MRSGSLGIVLPDKLNFPRAREIAYLDTAAEGLPPVACLGALEKYYRDKASGSPGRKRLYEAETETRAALATLLGTSFENIALLDHVSGAVNLLANSMDWRPGDEVLLSDIEYPSNLLAFSRAQELGVRLRVIESHGGEVGYDSLASAIGPSTRLVVLSLVSYKTGAYFPHVSELAQEAHRVGAVLYVDATQALGRVPVSLDGVDYLACSSYKWLLGSHGLAVVYVSPQFHEQMRPATSGWYSVQDLFGRQTPKPGAACLVAGMPNFPAIYALRESVAYLQAAGVECVENHLRPLVRQLRDGLAGLGLDLLTPAGPAVASGIVSFAHPQAESIAELLGAEGVVVWAGEGRVRASVHLYNDQADVSRLLSVLKVKLGVVPC